MPFPSITEKSGSRSATGIAVESEFGQATAATAFLPMTGNTLEVDPGWFSPELMMGVRDLHVFNMQGEEKFEGAVEGPLFPSNAIQLLVAAIGTDAVTGTAAPYCADEETEILTADGWKSVHQLRAGDEALTYNHETGMSEWQPVLEVCVFPAERRELIRMKGRGHSPPRTTAGRSCAATTRTRATAQVPTRCAGLGLPPRPSSSATASRLLLIAQASRPRPSSPMPSLN